MLPLRELQLRFSAALTAGTCGPAETSDRALLAALCDRGGLGPAERLEIYADMYRTRLADVLRDDFPRVQAIVGEEAFRALALRYLARHPSTHPSVRYVGRHFAGFVAQAPAVPAFLADLARLEWARVEVFDAADAEPLRLTDLESLDPAEWPALRLRPIAACLVIECAWPVHLISAEPGSAGGVPAVVAQPAPTTIRVWREGFDVSHVAMGALERRLFPLLERGVPFAQLCAAAESGLEPDVAAREVGGLLMRWLEDGLLARLPSPCSSG
ncbi:MAG TPA: DNA-binding domain-containing protein [Methylomirabilota bacterium]|nr:DNA-binding domain-containing protein [Methylomirabilota bacterium]